MTPALTHRRPPGRRTVTGRAARGRGGPGPAATPPRPPSCQRAYFRPPGGGTSGSPECRRGRPARVPRGVGSVGREWNLCERRRSGLRGAVMRRGCRFSNWPMPRPAAAAPHAPRARGRSRGLRCSPEVTESRDRQTWEVGHHLYPFPPFRRSAACCQVHLRSHAGMLFSRI